MDEDIYDIDNMASMSDFTGVVPSGIENESEAEAYRDAFHVNAKKPFMKRKKNGRK